MSVLSVITELLPPPTFLRMPAVGIDISDSSVKYAFFEPDNISGRHLHLASWGSVAVPDGTLSSGTVQNVEDLSMVLKEVRKQTGVDVARISLPEERAYIFETNLDKDISTKEIRGQLEFKLEENVPLSPREAYFDYEVFPDTLRTGKWRVVVTVYAKETIESYYQACKLAGITPLSFEVESQAIARSVVPVSDPRTHLLLDLGYTRSGLGVVSDGVLMYTSTIEVGGKHLSDSLREVLGDKKEDEFTSVKNSSGLVPSADQPEISHALVSVIDKIVDDINTRVQYWNVRTEGYEERQIQSVFVCGGGANLRGLPSYLSSQLALPVKRGNVWTNLYDLEEFVPPIDRRHSYGYATAIGLAAVTYL